MNSRNERREPTASRTGSRKARISDAARELPCAQPPEACAVAEQFVLYPAIDVREGRVVRLAQGDYSRETRFSADPFALARRYEAQGARWLHLVDLDAARAGGYTLHALLARIADETGLDVQTGGGVRTVGDVEDLFESGAARVVVGTLAVTHPRTVLAWIERFGAERICVAVDVRRDASQRWIAATHGWTGATGTVDAATLIQSLTNGGLRHLLSTDINRDGMFTGPALDWYAELVERFPGVAVQASGGIRDHADIAAARAAKCAGVIVGRALLEGKVDLAESLRC